MERDPNAQAPNTNPDSYVGQKDPSELPAHVVNPDQRYIYTSLQRAAEGDILNPIEGSVDEEGNIVINPEQYDPNTAIFREKPSTREASATGVSQPEATQTRISPTGNPEAVKKPSHKNAWIAAGLASAVAVTGVVVGAVKFKNDTDEIKDIIRNGNTGPVATAPYNSGEKPGMDYSKVDPTTLTVGEFYNDAKYPEEYRIRWAKEIINERAAAAIPKLNALRARNGNRPLGELVPASENNTGDEILVQRDLAWFIASTEPDPNLGRKLFAAVMDDDHPGFSTMLDTIDGGRNPVTETYIVYGGPMMGGGGSRTQETPTFYQTSVGDYVPGGTPSKIVKSTGTSTGTLNLITFKFVEGDWLQANTLHEGDPDWITKPQAISVR